MDSGGAAPSLPRFQRLFIAPQNLFCCGTEAEPECGLGAAGGHVGGSRWVLGHICTPYPETPPAACSCSSVVTSLQCSPLAEDLGRSREAPRR